MRIGIRQTRSPSVPRYDAKKPRFAFLLSGVFVMIGIV